MPLICCYGVGSSNLTMSGFHVLMAHATQAVVCVRGMLSLMELLSSPAKEEIVVKKRIVLGLFLGLVVVTAALVWATESAPSNTVGFFSFDLSAGSR